MLIISKEGINIANMEAFHPISTPHFKLDWLTVPTVKETNQLRNQLGSQESIEQTVNYINQAMRHTMGQTAISWVVFNRTNHQAIGWVTILNQKNAIIDFHLLSVFDTPVYKDEIKQHLASIIKELKINIDDD